jgi:hypothetical protein
VAAQLISVTAIFKALNVAKHYKKTPRYFLGVFCFKSDVIRPSDFENSV